MTLQPLEIPGCFAIDCFVQNDPRGQFVKTYQKEEFEANGVSAAFTEEYYSISHGGVLRGLHFQVPPAHHGKMVHCMEGEILDAIVDLRIGSPTFGQHQVLSLSGKKPQCVYMPAGIAHGFFTSSPRAIVVYNVTSSYAPTFDGGVRWNTAGISWPTSKPIISARDQGFPALDEFQSPFRYETKGS